MKTAMELRAGNVFMLEKELMVVMRGEFSKSGRNSSVVKLKYRTLQGGRVKEEVYKADDKFEDILLDRKPCTYSYFADPMYVFMDEEYNQIEVSPDNMGESMNYLEDGMACEVVVHEGKALSIEMPNIIEREVGFTERSARGDTVGKVMKKARLKNTNYELDVPAIVEIGDKIEIDTRTNEFRRRVV